MFKTPPLTEKFKRGERLLVAVSGGVDSVVLLHLLIHLPKPQRPAVEVAHFDHRLRGRESLRDAHFVQKLSARQGVPFHSGTAPVWRSKENLESRARELRYRFFVATARKLGIRKLLTAHQADDQAETFLIRWLQGAGLKGLAGIPSVTHREGVQIIRPLLLVRREEIVAYARHHRLPFRTDSTNQTDRYLRNRVRRVLKTLKRENPNLAARTATNSLFLRADEDYLNQRAEEIVQKFSGSFPLSIYAELPEALRYRLLRQMARPTAAHPLDGEKILKLDRLLCAGNPQSRYDLGHGVRFLKDSIHFEMRQSS